MSGTYVRLLCSCTASFPVIGGRFDCLPTRRIAERELRRCAMLASCERYTLRLEYLSWQLAVDRFGLHGLRTTRLQEYRRKPAPSF